MTLGLALKRGFLGRCPNCGEGHLFRAFVKVADTAFSAKTDGNGRVRFEGVPPGPVVARIWHPWMRAPANEIEARWGIAAGGQVQQVRVSLRPPPPAAPAY